MAGRLGLEGSRDHICLSENTALVLRGKARRGGKAYLRVQLRSAQRLKSIRKKQRVSPTGFIARVCLLDRAYLLRYEHGDIRKRKRTHESLDAPTCRAQTCFTRCALVAIGKFQGRKTSFRRAGRHDRWARGS